MNRNNPYQSVPSGTPVVAQTVVIPARTGDWSSSAYKIGIGILAVFLTMIGIMLLFAGVMSLTTSYAVVPSVILLGFGVFLILVAGCLWNRKGCRRSSPGQVVGPAQVATQTVGVPVVGQVVTYPSTLNTGQVITYPTTQATGQVVTYPTTPAAPGVPGGLVSTYTYTPPNQPSPAQAPAPTYPYPAGGQAPNYPSPGQVPAPAYPYAGGQAPSYPMDQKPPIGAPAEAPVGASAPGFQAPPMAPSPYFPEYQAPPPYAPDEKPPPYSN